MFGELSVSEGEWQGIWAINPSGRVCVITIRGTHDTDASLAPARELFREFRAQAGHIRGQIRSLLEDEPIGEFIEEVVLPGLDLEPENIDGPLGPIELEEILFDVTGAGQTLDQQATVLTDDDLELDNDEFIGEWNARQRITVPTGAARGTYDYSDPTYASRNRCNGILLRVNDRLRGCDIVDEAEDRVLQTLTCDPMSDWASPSISRNGRTITILEPYEVSFYRQIRPAGDARDTPLAR